jgi:hypothetical protein
MSPVPPAPAPWRRYGARALSSHLPLQGMLFLGSLLLTTSLFAAQPLAPVGGGNALTLPAQRHVVRFEPPDGAAIWLLALQQDVQQRRGLGFYRSDDEGQTWRYEAPIQNDWTHRDTADLLPVGMDLALVYSYEASTLAGSVRHDVYFQWWRYQPKSRSWTPSPAVQIFDSTQDTTGYSRAELARDSRGRLWVQAFRLEPDGTHTAVLAVSEDEGRTFRHQQPLARLEDRGGGRLLHLGDRLLFVYGHHGVSPAWFRMRMDSAPLDDWQPEQEAFPEGIYHGAALSAVSPGPGRMHLVYKSVSEQLFYRAFEGTAFGPRVLLESSSDWALQSATTLVGDELVVFYNPPVELNLHHTLVARVLRGGRFSPPVLLEDSRRFRGYLAAPKRLPAWSTRVPCFYGETPDANSNGTAALTFVELGVPEPHLEVVHTNTTHRFLAVAPSGTAYALQLDDSPSRLYVSTDGARTWTFRAQHPLGGAFHSLSALADGTLLATTLRGGRASLSRSGDGGATWSEVLPLEPSGQLTHYELAELDGTVYLLQGQDLNSLLYASTDQGRTWRVRMSFRGHRLGRGLTADPAHHALWAFFGRTALQGGVFRSTDGGRSWTRVLSGQKGHGFKAAVLGDGSLLFGQGAPLLSPRPRILQLAPDGTYVEVASLTGPASSTYAVRGGGFVLGNACEPFRGCAPSDEVSAQVWASQDGLDWVQLLRYPRLAPGEEVRADVYHELPSGLLVLQLQNAEGFGPGGVGYQLLSLTQQRTPSP